MKLGDVHVVEEKNHYQCYQQLKFCPFCYGTITNTSNLDTIKETAFLEICYSLSDKKLTLDNSGKKKPNFVSLCTPPYSSKHLKRRLAESVAQVKPNAAKLKNDLLITLLCQLMIHITSRRWYFFLLSLSVGIFLHQTTQSRVFLEVLPSLGLYASYSKVMKCEQATGASRTSGNDTLNSLSVESKINSCQWVAEGFYFNLDTIYGMD